MFAIRIFSLRNLVFYLQGAVAAAQTDEVGREALNTWDIPLLYVIVYTYNIDLMGSVRVFLFMAYEYFFLFMIYRYIFGLWNMRAIVSVIPNEHGHSKSYKLICIDRPVQLCNLTKVSPLFETDLGHRLPKECSSKTDQTAQSQSLIWVLTECIWYFVGITVLPLTMPTGLSNFSVIQADKNF